MATVLSEDERKARRKARKRATYVKYYARPEVRARILVSTAIYSATPEGKARNRAYTAKSRAKPEIKERLRRKYLSQYGITLEQYEDMFTSQNRTCKICDCSCTTGWRLAVDHCHETGKVRGLLCASCNTSLGKLKDSPAILATALGYLLDHGKALSTEDASALLDKLHHCT